MLTEPIDYKKYNQDEKNEFLIKSYSGYYIEKEGIEKGWTSGNWFSYTGGGCGVNMHGTEDETYAYIVAGMICKHPNMVKYRYSKSWDKLIPIIQKLRNEKVYTQAFKNQMRQIDYWLNGLMIEQVVKYIAGAINVLHGKKGAYPV